jgi:hypothetical protein
VIIDDSRPGRTCRFDEQDVLSALREAFSQRLEWHGFSPHQLSVVLFLHGYLLIPPADFNVESALPFALGDWEGAA